MEWSFNGVIALLPVLIYRPTGVAKPKSAFALNNFTLFDQRNDSTSRKRKQTWCSNIRPADQNRPATDFNAVRLMSFASKKKKAQTLYVWVIFSNVFLNIWKFSNIPCTSSRVYELIVTYRYYTWHLIRPLPAHAHHFLFGKKALSNWGLNSNVQFLHLTELTFKGQHAHKKKKRTPASHFSDVTNAISLFLSFTF